jgi:hypothetical protein
LQESTGVFVEVPGFAEGVGEEVGFDPCSIKICIGTLFVACVPD